MRAVELSPIKMQIKFPLVGGQPYDLLSLNELSPNPPMGDQTLDCADSEAVLLADLHQFGQTRHRPIIVQNFTKDARGFETGHGREIDCRFGVPCTAEDTAILGAQRKDV